MSGAPPRGTLTPERSIRKPRFQEDIEPLSIAGLPVFEMEVAGAPY